MAAHTIAVVGAAVGAVPGLSATARAAGKAGPAIGGSHVPDRAVAMPPTSRAVKLEGAERAGCQQTLGARGASPHGAGDPSCDGAAGSAHAVHPHGDAGALNVRR
jgi:hypothetical protein